jgi:hypothetical protein
MKLFDVNLIPHGFIFIIAKDEKEVRDIISAEDERYEIEDIIEVDFNESRIIHLC